MSWGKKLLVLTGLFFLSGCAAAMTSFETMLPVSEVPEHRKTTSFQIGQVQETTLGEPMVVEEDLFFYNGLVAIEDYQIPPQGMVYYPVLKKGTMLKARGALKNGDKIYQPIDGESPSIRGGEKVKWEYCIVVNANNEAYGVTACTLVYVQKWPAPSRFLSPGEVYDRGTMKHELIYNGKSQDTIRLHYREFNEDMARPAFYQDLTYDLSESKSIAFKKMKIEVIEATNSHIKFIVNSSMR